MMLILLTLLIVTSHNIFPSLQVSELPPTLQHLWLADVTTPGLNPGVVQDPTAVQNPMLGQTLAGRLPQLLTLVLRSAAPGGPPVVDTADLAAIATGAKVRSCATASCCVCALVVCRSGQCCCFSVHFVTSKTAVSVSFDLIHFLYQGRNPRRDPLPNRMFCSSSDVGQCMS
jgi:hypothetical protein